MAKTRYQLSQNAVQFEANVIPLLKIYYFQQKLSWLIQNMVDYFNFKQFSRPTMPELWMNQNCVNSCYFNKNLWNM